MRKATPLLAVTALSAQLFCAQLALAEATQGAPGQAETKKKPKPAPKPKPEPRPSGNGKRSSYDDAPAPGKRA
ncbi:MAG: hypothetical protein HOV80_31590 [Polyangiaceae bacterium]|nr:hypothetical protein [Polyangiaceae bacterium]